MLRRIVSLPRQANAVGPHCRRFVASAIKFSRVPKLCTPQEAVAEIQSNQRIWLQGVGSTPQRLVNALVARAPELRNVEIMHLHTEASAPYVDPKYKDSFFNNNVFVGRNVRKAVQEGRAGYVPVFLSEVPVLLRKRILPLDYALVQVSPPDSHGYCSLGVAVDATRAAVETASHVIAQINPNVPRTHGDGVVHISWLDSVVDADDPLIEHKRSAPTEVEERIGKFVAEMVENGATLQMGIGAIPDAVLKQLTTHKRLGAHTEMFSDGLIDLVERGVVTCEDKVVDPFKIVAGFLNGTKKLFDFVNDNPFVHMKDIAYVNDPSIIKRNPKVTAINSAIEVDLTGQVCADSIGGMIYSGVGGQMDFLRGAALSEGGKPIIALPSTTSFGQTRIVPHIHPGGGVVTTRAHVHYVVTEWGVAYLYGKNLQQRARALIDIAHPRHRKWLEDQVGNQYWRAKEYIHPPRFTD